MPSAYAKFRPNRRGYDAAIWNCRFQIAATPQLDSVEDSSCHVTRWRSIHFTYQHPKNHLKEKGNEKEKIPLHPLKSKSKG